MHAHETKKRRTKKRSSRSMESIWHERWADDAVGKREEAVYECDDSDESEKRGEGTVPSSCAGKDHGMKVI